MNFADAAALGSVPVSYASARSLGSAFIPRRGKQSPRRDEQGSDQRTDDEPVQPEQAQAAERGNQHHVVRHLGVLAHQDGTQDIVDQTDDQHAVQNQDHALYDEAFHQEIDRHGRPDYPGADGRQQRQESHQHTTEHRAGDSQYRENDSSQCPLRRRDDDVALYGGANHAGEFAEQPPLLVIAQRHCLSDASDQFAAIAQQEEKQVEHQEEAQHELEGTLPETEGLGRQELAALQGATGQTFANLVHVAQPETLHLRLPGCRQQLLRMADEAVRIEFTALHLLVERRAFLHQHPGNEIDRQHPHHQADEQGGNSCEVSPRVQAGEQATLYRGEDDRQDHGPEHRTV